MAVQETNLDGYLRYIKISAQGKSDEARQGAFIIIQEIIRALQSLREEDQTYDVVMDFMESLLTELPPNETTKGQASRS